MDTLLCEVCHRPSPDKVCSRRCQGLARIKKSLDIPKARELILLEIKGLEKDTSICPGRLSRLVLEKFGIELKEERDGLSLLRETLFAMRDEGKLRFFQKNQLVPKAKGPLDIKGPIRVKGKS